jgi:mRNA capping enzyme, C-terminal domain
MDCEKALRKRLGKSKGFPGAQPVNVSPQSKLKNYYISNKFDGERFIIFGCDGASWKMDRKCEITQVPFDVSEKDIFDVEKVGKNYYILDYLSLNKKTPFSKRKEIFENIHAKYYSSSPLKLKLFLDTSQESLDPLKEELARVHKAHRSEFEGYIFTKKSLGIVFGTCKFIMKWKPFELNTVDFYYSKKQIFIGGDRGLTFVSKIKIIEPEVLEKLRDSDIIECYPKVSRGQIIWKFYRFRKDKNYPNFITVYYNILETLNNFKDIKEYLIEPKSSERISPVPIKPKKLRPKKQEVADEYLSLLRELENAQK